MDDMIDFRVSDTWRDHYAAQGLTYSSGRHERVIERRLSAIDKDLQRLGEILKQLRDEPSRPASGLGPDYDGIDPLSP